MQIKYKISLLFLALALIASSCPDERPELVSPPSFSETVNIRFLNLSKSNTLSLGLDGVAFSDFVGKYKMSKPFHPENDSAFISLFEGNNELFELSRVVKFSRELNYVFISTPNPNNYSLDTLFSFTNIGDIVVTEVEASVKFINLYADTNSRISIIKGCPGGELISKAPLKYMEYTSADPERAGEDFIFSVVKYKDNGSYDILGTYKTNFKAYGEYTIVIAGNENELPDIFSIDELDISLNQITNAEQVGSQVAFYKHINLGDSDDNIKLNGIELVSSASGAISNFNEIGSCKNASSDTFTDKNGTEVLFSPEVNTQYMGISYNVSSTINSEFMIISPPILDQNRVGKAVIRCLNLSSENSSLNFSLGANSNFINKGSNDTIRNFSTGLSLAIKLDYKILSSPKIIEPGLMPILVFNSYEPADYLFSFLYKFEPNKNYVIVSYLKNGKTEYTVLEQTEENIQVQSKDEAAIINIVNGDESNKSHLINLNCSLGQVLNNAQLTLANTITTAVSAGNVDVAFSSNSSNAITESGKRYYSIKTESNLFEFENNKQSADIQTYQFRVANLSDIAKAKVKTISGIDTTIRLVKSDAGTMSNYVAVNSQGRILVMFEDRETEKIIFTSPEVNVSKKKIYTFILVGNSTKGYRLITLQDY